MSRTATKSVVDPAEAEAAAWDVLQDEALARLRERIREHGAPPPPYAPIFDNVFVYRFPSNEDNTKTASGLHIPDIAREEVEPKSHGLLLAAGLEARDHLRTHGVLVGDIIHLGRFAGWERLAESEKSGKGRKKLLQLRVQDVLGSEDLDERLNGRKPTMRIEYRLYDDTGMHVIRPIF